MDSFSFCRDSIVSSNCATVDRLLARSVSRAAEDSEAIFSKEDRQSESSDRRDAVLSKVCSASFTADSFSSCSFCTRFSDSARRDRCFSTSLDTSVKRWTRTVLSFDAAASFSLSSISEDALESLDSARDLLRALILLWSSSSVVACETSRAERADSFSSNFDWSSVIFSRRDSNS